MERDGVHGLGPDHGADPDPFGLRARARASARALAARAATVRIELDLDRRVAAGEEHALRVRRVRVVNLGPLAREDLRLELRLGPGRRAVAARGLDVLEPHGVWLLEDLELALDPSRRRRRDAPEWIELEAALELPDGLWASTTERIELLPWNAWPGLGAGPERVAAFVLPGDPALDELAGEVQEQRAADTPDATLRAVWEVVARRAPTLVSTPAGAHVAGLPIRSPERVLGAGLGTALDLACLGAALLERLGRAPLLLFAGERVLFGLWLEAGPFEEPVVLDARRVAKRVAAELIAAVDPEGWTARPPLDAAAARDRAATVLEDAPAFEAAVDVAAARARGLPPREFELPSDGAAAPPGVGAPTRGAPTPGAPTRGTPTSGDPTRGSDAAAAPAAAAARSSGSLSVDARLEAWKRRLLDLSLHNRFLAFRETRRTLTLEPPPPAELERHLAGGATLELVAAPERDGAPAERDREAQTRADERARELAGGRLRAAVGAAELDRRLTELARGARASLEESGANTLYLASGFLVWREPDRPGRELRAPLLLRPLELERPRGGGPWRLRAADDDPRGNEALVEKLAAEYGLDPEPFAALPIDDDGVRVEDWLRAWRRATVDRQGWEVVDEAALGLFSFTKFLMWRDLDARREDLVRARVSRFLIERPSEPFEVEPPVLPEAEPSELALVLDADASQTRAIREALAGRSMVLEGPPGTGKSQTIANLIAGALARGQRVLFVAEKRAALEVVQRRLEAVGLGPWCLELHSDKASRRAVVEQLGRPLEHAPVERPAALDARGRELDALTAELDAHVRRLHHERSGGLDLYRALTRSAELEGVPRVAPAVEDPHALAGPDREALLREVGGLARAASLVEPGVDHPLAAVRLAELGPADRRRVERATEALGAAAAELERVLAPAGSALGLDRGALADRAALDALEQLATALEEAASGELRDRGRLRVHLARLLAEPNLESLAGSSAPALERARQTLGLRRALLARWEPALLAADLAGLQDEIEALRRRNPLARWLGRRRLSERLVGLHRDPRAADLAGLAGDLRDARTLVAATEELTAGALGRVLGPDWFADEDTVDAAARATARALELRARARSLVRTAADPGRALETLCATLAAWFGAEPGRAEREALAAVRAPLDAFRAALAEAREALDLDLERLDAGGRLLDDVAGLCAAIDEWGPRLRDWCLWQGARGAAERGPLAPLLAELEAGRLTPGLAVDAAEAGLLEAWIESAVEGEPALRRFHGLEHEQRLARFRDLDRRWLETCRDALVARLSAAVPRPGAATADGSELGLLLRELRKRRGHLPVRRLLERLPTLLPRLAPCFLMSPLSTARFLDPGTSDFDLVVFDEASQIPAWDGVGAMARGRTVVVVGDSKQLPPTTFFQHGPDEEADDEELEELDSLLDECIACGLPRRTLDWHYRSRHESLIAFSNAHYYAGRLETFPAPTGVGGGAGLEWELVEDGVYDRAGTRTNPREARALVERVLEALDVPGDPPSVGVVTFSQAQQVAVEELLERELAARPELEARARARPEEPLFVKNLENVQGDERDVVLLGVGYGPDAAGRFPMHFGPLNRRGGERRLNVAVTRARRRLRVLSSFRPEAIDLVRTGALGPRHLRAFLEFAASGWSRLHVDDGTGAPRTRAGRDVFALRLARAFEARGFAVELRAGAGRARVDLALSAGGRSVAVLLDGAQYARAASARDRDRLRVGVLEGLGWRVLHAWTLDLWSDPEGTFARLAERVEPLLAEQEPRARASEASSSAVEAGPQRRVPTREVPTREIAARRAAEVDDTPVDDTEAVPAGTEPPAAERRPSDVDDPTGGRSGYGDTVEDEPSGAARRVDPAASDAAAGGPLEAPVTDRPRTEELGDAPAPPEPPAGAPGPAPDERAPERSADAGGSGAAYPGAGPRPYAYARPASRARRRERFHDAAELERIGQVLCEVVEVEGPVHAARAQRRVAAAWGFDRVGSRLLERVEQARTHLDQARRPRLVDGFLWPPGVEPASHRGFRGVDARGEAPRDAEELPLEEVANAARHVLDQNLALDRADLVRELARLFGFARAGRRFERRAAAALEHLAARGGCRIEGERVTG